MADANDTHDDSNRPPDAARFDGRDGDSAAREREERLAELTDQSLDLLDQLAEARRRVEGLEVSVRDAEVLRTRLEGALADARRRVRSTRSLGGLRPTSDAVAVDVVLWTEDDAFDAEWLAGAVAALEGRSVTVLAPPAGRVDVESFGERVRVLAADGRSPAHLANLALASTDAPVVLLVLAGSDLEPIEAALAAGAFAAIDDETVALGQPVLVHPDGDESLGLEETQSLRMRRLPHEPSASAAVPLEFVSPEVVAVRRGAFERLGPFDEDLRSVYAFVEYSLRAVRDDSQLVGLPTVRVPVSGRLLPGPRRLRVRDRLITLAQHRHGEMGSALGAEEIYWTIDPVELAALLGALLRRIPGADAWPEAVDRLVAEAVGLSGRTIPGPALDERLAALGRIVQAMTAIPGEPPTPEEQELRAAADEAPGSDPASTIHRMAKRLEAERIAKAALVEAVGAARAEAERFKVDAEQLVARELQSARDRSRAVEERARHHEADATAAKERAFAVHEQVADARAKLRAALHELTQERDQRAAERAETAARHREELARLAAALGLDVGADLGAIFRHVGVVLATLQDRERWLVTLLDELSRRWLGRKLRPHELEFLNERGAAR